MLNINDFCSDNTVSKCLIFLLSKSESNFTNPGSKTTLIDEVELQKLITKILFQDHIITAVALDISG